jgi:hypothetical protein
LNPIGDPRTDPLIYAQLIFNRRAQLSNAERIAFSINDARTIGYPWLKNMT